MAKFCHECGAPLLDIAKFCASCGTQTPILPMQPSQTPSTNEQPKQPIKQPIEPVQVVESAKQSSAPPESTPNKPNIAKFCKNCGSQLTGIAKFCSACGYASHQTPSIERFKQTSPKHVALWQSIKQLSLHKTPRNIQKNKLVKKKPVIGLIMFFLGILSFLGCSITLGIIEPPSVYDYSIWGYRYENALEEYQVIKVVLAIGIFISFVIMLISLCIVLANRKKMKEQQ